MSDTVTLTLTVTQHQIDTGAAKDCYNCPVALAMLEAARKQWPAQNDLNVQANTAALRIWSTSVNDHFLYRANVVPDEVRAFIRHYDDGEQVHPITVTVPFHLDRSIL